MDINPGPAARVSMFPRAWWSYFRALACAASAQDVSAPVTAPEEIKRAEDEVREAREWYRGALDHQARVLSKWAAQKGEDS